MKRIPNIKLHSISNSKRDDVPSRYNVYMAMANLISKRSKDPNTKVGAVIVSKYDRILSIGYNGFPNGCSDKDFPWTRDAESEYDTKYPYVVHAELNAILNFRGDNKALEGSTLFVTLFPCRECTKAIIQSGISRIIYLDNKYSDTDDYREAKRMLDAANIITLEYSYVESELIEIGDSKPL